ncbi:hypothetical protein [Yersinia bercovieri]|uniref:hypothetical protein n=1 Tax=Yersinia bercovieri TaxID=634 RepID=UPI0011A155EA|nr:hypothetical protein [Yersinia bercovieri]
MSQIISVTMARPSEDEVKSLWQLFHATEAAEDRWHRESSEQFLERLGDQDISDEERAFIAVAWDSLVQGHGGFGRFMGAYDTLIYNFQDPNADHVAIHPKFNALFTESELLPVVLEGYADARNTIAELENERDAALNTCTLIAEALGITGAVAGDTITRVQQLVGENAVLTDKAASELSNSWLLHRAVMTIQAALHCIHGTNIYEAQCWLESIADDAELVIPPEMMLSYLQRWFDENMTGLITHAQAVEIIKAEMSATTQALNEYIARSIVAPDGYQLCFVPLEQTTAFRDACTTAYEESLNGTGPCGVFMAGYRSMLTAAPKFAASLRGEQNAS